MLVHLAESISDSPPVQESTLLSKQTDGINEGEKWNKMLSRLCLKVCCLVP